MTPKRALIIELIITVIGLASLIGGTVWAGFLIDVPAGVAITGGWLVYAMIALEHWRNL